MNSQTLPSDTQQARARQMQRAIDESPVRYLRTGMVIRESARAEIEANPELRAWSRMLSLIGVGIMVFCIVGALLS